MPPNQELDMTGPGLTQLIIPVAGTLFLTAWLALVFYADRHSRRAGGHAASAQGRKDLVAVPVQEGDLREIFGAQR
jgi:hypothetical protein